MGSPCNIVDECGFGAMCNGVCSRLFSITNGQEATDLILDYGIMACQSSQVLSDGVSKLYCMKEIVS